MQSDADRFGRHLAFFPKFSNDLNNFLIDAKLLGNFFIGPGAERKIPLKIIEQINLQLAQALGFYKIAIHRLKSGPVGAVGQKDAARLIRLDGRKPL